MNKLAEELNQTLQSQAPHLYEMLSSYGKEIYFPKGILHQGAEAGQKAKKFNATVGIALEKGVAMHLPCIKKHVPDLTPAEMFTYAPPQGLPKLREAWRSKLLAENPSMKDKSFSMPIVTCAIAHGLSCVAELFVSPGDPLILPDQYWDNYPLTFCVRNGAELFTYPTFTPQNRFDAASMEAAILKHGKARGKAIVLLNFPNNPTGYTIGTEEAVAITAALERCAKAGINLVVLHDDAYFGLVFESTAMKESLFGYTANLHERLLAVKLCGATKEEYVWGFRTGFVSYGIRCAQPDAVFAALEKKTMGVIRVSVSNSPSISQNLVLKALLDPAFPGERQHKYDILKNRVHEVKRVLENPTFAAYFTPYPFNAGYFMCLRLKNIKAEALRVHLLDKYGVGTIATAESDLRIAFSCIEESDIKELFDIIGQGCADLAGK